MLRCTNPAPQARLPAPDRGWALFLDLDGTLIELAETPDRVRPDSGLAPLLHALGQRLGGALALVSGRGLADIDRLVQPFRGAAAALHGLVRRDAAGGLHETEVDEAALRQVAEMLGRFAAAHPEALLENKGRAIALHYRRKPALEGQVQELARRAVAPHGSLVLQPGKMVVEVKPQGADKGRAVAAFLGEPPFRGRRPVMIGDDLTDEHGFAVAVAAGGYAIRVGDAGAPSAATHRIADVGALRRWLDRLPALLA